MANRNLLGRLFRQTGKGIARYSTWELVLHKFRLEISDRGTDHWKYLPKVVMDALPLDILNKVDMFFSINCDIVQRGIKLGKS